jgi:hypothetical protein
VSTYAGSLSLPLLLPLIPHLVLIVIEIDILMIVTAVMDKGVGRRTPPILSLRPRTVRPSTVRVVEEEDDVNEEPN